MDEFKKIISNLLRRWKQFSALAVIGTTIWTAAIRYEHKRQMEAAKDLKIASVDSIVRAQADSNNIFRLEIRSGFYSLSQKVEQYSSRQNEVVNSYKHFLQNNKSITKEEYLKLTEGIDNLTNELKKNTSGTSWLTPSGTIK
jgi:hypothetical protein